MPKRYRKTTSSKRVRKMIKREVNRSLEKKYIYQNGGPAAAGDNNMKTTWTFSSLLASNVAASNLGFVQGSTESQRVGNKVMIKYIY